MPTAALPAAVMATAAVPAAVMATASPAAGHLASLGGIAATSTKSVIITRLKSVRCARVRMAGLPRHPMMSERIEMLPIVAASLKYAIGSASSLTASA